MKLSYDIYQGRREIEVTMIVFLNKSLIFNRKEDATGYDRAIQTSPIINIEKVDEKTVIFDTGNGYKYTLSDELLNYDYIVKLVNSSDSAVRCLFLS